MDVEGERGQSRACVAFLPDIVLQSLLRLITSIILLLLIYEANSLKQPQVGYLQLPDLNVLR